MAFNLKNMTVDYKSLLKLTIQDRVNMSKSSEGLSWLAGLTPSQLAELFPSYYRKKLPDLGQRFLSGGTKMDGPSLGLGGRPAGGSSSLGNYQNQGGVPMGPVKPGAKNPEQPQPSNAKPSWAAKLEKYAEKPADTPQQAQGGQTTTTQKASGRSGPIDRSAFAKELKDPEVRKMFAGMMKAEVGSQGRNAQIAFAETVFNRAAYSNQSLRSILEKKPTRKQNYYEPHRTGKYDAVVSKMSKEDFKRAEALIDHVYGGSDTTQGAAHNASAGVAADVKNGGYDAVKSTVKDIGKETYYLKKWEVDRYKKLPRLEDKETNQAFAESQAVPKRDPNQTGSTGPMNPLAGTPAGEKVAPVTNNTIVPPLPSGLNEKVMDYYNTLPTEEKKTQFRQQVHAALRKDETVETLNKSAAESTQVKPTATRHEETPKVATGTNGQKLYDVNSFGKGPNLQRSQLEKQGVDPLLIESIYEGSKVAFGDPKDPKTRYVVQVNNAARSDPSSKHGHGKAADAQIFDRETGKYVGGSNSIFENALGNPHTYRHFEAWAQGQYKYLHDKYGEKVANRLTSGLYFKARQNNSFDNMHISLDEHGRQGSIRQGASEEFQKKLADARASPSQPMGDVSKWKSPFAPVTSESTLAESNVVPKKNPAIKNPAITGSTSYVAPEYDYKRWSDIIKLKESGELAKLPQERREEIYRHYHKEFKSLHDAAKSNPESAQASNNALSRVNILKQNIDITPERRKEITTVKPISERAFTAGKPSTQAPAPVAAPTPTPTPAPEAPAPAPEPKPPEPTAIIEPKVEKKVPEFAHGGEAQASGDNAYVVGESGKPLFKMNTEKERMSYDPGANSLKVEPTHRTNTDALQQRSIDRQDDHEQYSSAKENSVTPRPAQNQPSQSSGNKNWDHMMNSMMQSSANLYETASFHRAVAKSRFIEVGDSVKGGHYSYGASNLKWL